MYLAIRKSVEFEAVVAVGAELAAVIAGLDGLAGLVDLTCEQATVAKPNKQPREKIKF